MTPGTKREAGDELLRLVKEYDIDLVVLARYMQILSEDMCAQLAGRAINIHDPFLPASKAASPPS